MLHTTLNIDVFLYTVYIHAVCLLPICVLVYVYVHGCLTDLPPSSCPGHPIDRGGLPTACSHGLSGGPAPAHAALLAEGAPAAPTLHRCGILSGQADPQPQYPAGPGQP